MNDLLDLPSVQAASLAPSGSGVRGRQLESAEEALQEVAHRLAHDLRTPLRHVISYTELLQSAALPGQAATVEVAAHLKKVLEAARRLQRGLDDLALLARVRLERLQVRTVDMGALALAAWTDLGENDGSDPAGLVLQGPMPRVLGDEALLRTVWQRLLHILRRVAAASGMRGSVQVCGHPVPGGGHAFELLWIAEAESARMAVPEVPQEGEDTGRALVRRILGCHGGRLWPLVAQDRPGFGFWLPERQAVD